MAKNFKGKKKSGPAEKPSSKNSSKKQQYGLTDDNGIPEKSSGTNLKEDPKHFFLRFINESDYDVYMQKMAGNLPFIFDRSDSAIKECVEKSNSEFIHRYSQDVEIALQKNRNVTQAVYFDRCCCPDIPRRPKFDVPLYEVPIDEYKTAEERVFEAFFRNLSPDMATVAKEFNCFEINREVYRQLWRVTELSDVLCVIADARFPAAHLPINLLRYCAYAGKPVVIVLNKADLVYGEVKKGAYSANSSKQNTDDHFGKSKITMELERKAQSDNDEKKITSYKGKSSAKEEEEANYNNTTEYYENDSSYDYECDEQEQEIIEKASDGDSITTSLIKGLGLTNEHNRRIEEWCAFLREIYKEISTEIGCKQKEITILPACAITMQRSADIRANFLSVFTSEVRKLAKKTAPEKVTVGFIGQPSVGKSSMLNGIYGKKIVSVKITPGWTKSFQTYYMKWPHIEEPKLTKAEKRRLRKEKRGIPSFYKEKVEEDEESALDDDNNNIRGGKRRYHEFDGNKRNEHRRKLTEEEQQQKKEHLKSIFGFAKDETNDSFILCDCPGLVLPVRFSPRALQVLTGVFPVARIREFYSAIRLLCQYSKVNYDNLYSKVNIKSILANFTSFINSEELQRVVESKTPMDLLKLFAAHWNFVGKRGFDPHRAGIELFRKIAEGSLAYYFSPDSKILREMNSNIKRDFEWKPDMAQLTPQDAMFSDVKELIAKSLASIQQQAERISKWEVEQKQLKTAQQKTVSIPNIKKEEQDEDNDQVAEEDENYESSEDNL